MRIVLGQTRGLTLLFALSPTCGFCRVNFHNWRELSTFRNATPVWMDTTETATAQYLKSYGIDEESKFLLLDQANVKALKIYATPTTILVNSHGEEIWRQSGVIDPNQMEELRKLLSKH